MQAFKEAEAYNGSSALIGVSVGDVVVVVVVLMMVAVVVVVVVLVLLFFLYHRGLGFWLRVTGSFPPA